MEGKPIYYDGSVPHIVKTDEEKSQQNTIQMTDEARKNMSGNPYYFSESE